MVWTCSVTGKSGLTFQEAMESELSANHMIESLSEGLQIGVLYLASLMKENRITQVLNKIAVFIQNRYFVNEKIFATVNDKRFVKY